MKKGLKHKEGHHRFNSEYKKFALNAAKDLLYGDQIISSIENAQSDKEIESIMDKARCL